jgi:hypothetical protein
MILELKLRQKRCHNFLQFKSIYEDLLQRHLYSEEVMLDTETECHGRTGNIANLHRGGVQFQVLSGDRLS